MKIIPAALAAACLPLALAAGSCGPVKPMTESEFTGFCYQYSGSPPQGCVAIDTCDEYTTVMATQHASLQACLDDCSGVYAGQMKRRGLSGCLGAPENARDWCQRYCRTVYPK